MARSDSSLTAINLYWILPFRYAWYTQLRSNAPRYCRPNASTYLERPQTKGRVFHWQGCGAVCLRHRGARSPDPTYHFPPHVGLEKGRPRRSQERGAMDVVSAERIGSAGTGAQSAGIALTLGSGAADCRQSPAAVASTFCVTLPVAGTPREATDQSRSRLCTPFAQAITVF